MNRNLPAYLAAVLALALTLVLICGTFAPASFSLAEEEKSVYLTFDDGPSDRVTPVILDILKEENVKATFFIIGNQALTRQNIIKREAEEGHKVCVHSYSHKYGEIYSSVESLLKDIDKCNEVIKMITGHYSTLYRFPGGSHNISDKFKQAVKEHGLNFVDWNASLKDADIVNAKPEYLYNAAVETSAHLNSVVLLAHDSTSKTATAKALKDIIKYYKQNGFTFKTL